MCPWKHSTTFCHCPFLDGLFTELWAGECFCLIQSRLWSVLSGQRRKPLEGKAKRLTRGLTWWEDLSLSICFLLPPGFFFFFFFRSFHLCNPTVSFVLVPGSPGALAYCSALARTWRTATCTYWTWWVRLPLPCVGAASSHSLDDRDFTCAHFSGIDGKELWREVLHHHRKLEPQHASVPGCEWGNAERWWYNHLKKPVVDS